MIRSLLACTLCLVLVACSSDTIQPTVGLTTNGDAKTALDAQLGDSLEDAAQGADSAPVSDAAPDSALDATAAGGDAATDAITATADAAVDAVGDAAAKYGVCSNLFLCSQVACGQSMPKGCAQVCIDAASAEAQAQYLPFGLCVEQYCREGLCKNSSDVACMGNCAWQKCYGKLLPCGADGKTGSATCDAMIGCYEKCKKDGAMCMFNCYATLSTAAQSDYQAMNDCFVAAGGDDPGKSCPDQLFKCIAGGKSGAKSCFDTLLCTGTCDKLADSEKFGCIAACYTQATAADQKAFLSVSKCMGGTWNANCADDLLTCTNPSGTKNCLEAIMCIDPCKATGKNEGACIFSCMNQASKPEAKKYLELFMCMAGQCKSCNGDAKCEDTCSKAKCQTQLTACLAK